MRKLAIVFSLVIFTTSVLADDGWKWGANESAAKEKWSFLSYNINVGDYETASKVLPWLINNAPDLNEALYINAVKVYQHKAKTADATAKTTIQDSVLLMYDLRVEHFANEADVLNHKGSYAYAYWYNRQEKKEELFSLYKKIVDLNGTSTYASNAYAYMAVLAQKKAKGELTEFQVIEEYEKITNILDAQLVEAAADASKAQKVEAYQEKVNGMFNKVVSLDCEGINKYFGSKFKESPDVPKAKSLYNQLKVAKCTDDAMFLEVANYIVTEDPFNQYASAIYKEIALLEKANGHYDEAIASYEKSLENTSLSASERESLLLDVAHLYAKKGQLSSARGYAYKAIEANPESKDGYVTIGDLYMSSANTCANGDELQNRLIYIAAYDKYKMAGSTSKMAEAKAQFPSMESIFSRNKNIGDIVNTGCWINEDVKLEKR